MYLQGRYFLRQIVAGLLLKKFQGRKYYKKLQKILGTKMPIGRHLHTKAPANSIAHANDKELDLRRN
jgi:hypothetical protein